MSDAMENLHHRRDILKLAATSRAVSTLVSPADRRPASSSASLDSPAGSPGNSTDLCFLSARDLAALIRERKASAREVMAAHLERIRQLNPRLNAIVSKLDDDLCLALADAADQRAARGEPLPPLHGLPIAFKDLQPAVGFRFTRGSPIFRDDMPEQDSVLVERLRRAGAIPIGKTNTPEFGMGSHTYNNVFGTTRNPYDLSKSAGGSSGGAGAALAAGLLPIADGSDLGGSLRNPGNFNNVVGFRPSVGLVPSGPNPYPLLGFAVNGPLARTVADAAFLLSVMAGPDPRDPGCRPSNPAVFRSRLERSFRGVRVAWCPDLGGLPLDPRVRAVLEAQRQTFETLGCVVEEACPDLTDADSIFLTIRRFRSAGALGPLLAPHRHQMKPEAIAEIEAGLALSSADVAQAMIRHGELLDRMRRFEQTYEFFLCAVNQVPPFDVSVHWPTSINGIAGGAGVKMDHYIAWMKSAYWITTTFRPAISVPAGFTPDGLPIGIQIVGRYRDDLAVLQLAHAFEQATGFGKTRPALA
jgi:amidase